MISLSRLSGEITKIKIAGKDEWNAWLRSQKRSVSYPITYRLQRDGKGTTSSPSGHDIGYTSLRGYSLLPADHSGPIAMRGPIPLPPFYHKSGPMLTGTYLFPPLHDIRHLPAGDSKSRILLCKESTYRMISEEMYLYMIDLYFHKLNQLSYYSEFQSILRTVMTKYFLFPNLGVKHCS